MKIRTFLKRRNWKVMRQVSNSNFRTKSDKHKQIIMREPWDLMRRLSTIILRRAEDKPHIYYCNYKNAEISRCKGPEMDRYRSSQRAHIWKHVARNWPKSTCEKRTAIYIDWTSIHSPVSCSLDSERATCGLCGKPKTSNLPNVCQQIWDSL